MALSDVSANLKIDESELRRWVRGGLVQSRESDLSKSKSALFDLDDFKEFTGTAHNLGSTKRVVSFFSGCGGLDFGFRAAGFDLGFANDFFLDAVNTYANNLGPIDPRPIQEIAVNETGPATVLLAGFPCQPFSNAGSRLGTADPRGTLFWETLKFVEYLKPKVVVFENVRGLLSMRNPDGGLLIDAIEHELATRGYSVGHRLLNARKHGVPQNRHRVFIIGIRTDLNLGPFNFDLIETAEGKTVGEVLAKPFGNATSAEEHWPLSPQAMDLVNFIPPGGSWKNVPDEKLPARLVRIKENMARYHSPNFYRRFAPEEVMGTVTAAATPENSGILHPHLPRRYTIREVARFQSFPDEFNFLGKSVAAKYKQIGNAVPPELARRVAHAILLHLGIAGS
ncbi:MAG: DNA (cytosine-5-)-methyltransferase [Actinobacteria bacterium]|nr:DNA (cytosine-5-)-methyltransferase [Actinomycetota bacterium]